MNDAVQKLNELLQNKVDCSYAELVQDAKVRLARILPEFKALLGDNRSAVLLAFKMVATVIGVDSRLTPLEHQFVNEVFNTDFSLDELANEATAGTSSIKREQLDEILDTMSTELKSCALLFCIDFMAVDKAISRDEVSYIVKLIQ